MKTFDGNPAQPGASRSAESKDDKTMLDAPAAAVPPRPNEHPLPPPDSAPGSFEQKILLSSPIGIYIFDLKTGTNTFINPQYTRQTGYTLADLQALEGADFFALFHPQDRGRVAAHLERIGRAGDDAILEIEYRFKTADGRWIRCRARNAVFERNGQGAVRRIIGTLADGGIRQTAGRKNTAADLKTGRDNLEAKVQERTTQLQATVTVLQNEIQARGALENQLRQWSRVFMDAADPIIIENLAGTIIDMNREAEREYGWKRHELIGKSILSLIPSDQYSWTDRLREHCRRGQEVRNWESKRQDQKGRIFSVLLTAFPLLDESEKVTSVATIAKDISLRKQVERELEASQKHLQELSRKSIEALENERRTTARELHDGIGATLAAIKIRLEGIAEENAQKPQQAAACLAQSIADLQDAIKETKHISAKLRPTMLDDLGLLSTITWYVRQFSKQFGNIQLNCRIRVREKDIPENLKIVIYRVLQESLHNAAKHSQASEIALSLKADPDQIVFEVADNGGGFDVQKALARPDPFAGYGLASMQERAEIVDGALTIDSAPGQGTCIKMTLPQEPYASILAEKNG